jgi:hypothetical protein
MARFMQEFREGQRRGGKSNPVYVEFSNPRGPSGTSTVRGRRFGMNQVDGFYGVGDGIMAGLVAETKRPTDYRSIFRGSYDPDAERKASWAALQDLLRQNRTEREISADGTVGSKLDLSKNKDALDRNTAALKLLTRQAEQGVIGAPTGQNEQDANFKQILNPGGGADGENQTFGRRLYDTAYGALNQAVQMAIMGQGGWSDILRTVGAQFASTLLQQLFSAGGGPGGGAAGIGFSLISGLVTGLSGGGWKWGGKKATGGKVKQGYYYEVNEIGREYIAMTGDGVVIPAGGGKGMGGGGTTVNNNFYMTDRVTRESQSQVASRAAAASARAASRNG